MGSSSGIKPECLQGNRTDITPSYTSTTAVRACWETGRRHKQEHKLSVSVGVRKLETYNVHHSHTMSNYTKPTDVSKASEVSDDFLTLRWKTASELVEKRRKRFCELSALCKFLLDVLTASDLNPDI